MILVIDNYDSFVHNLARYMRELDQETKVLRNDQVTVEACLNMEPYAIVLSPGPGRPEGAGICLDLIAAGAEVPVLGVCLGHQCLAEAYGGCTVPALEPMHGRASNIEHQGTGLFAGLESPLKAGRYHSLAVNLKGVGDLAIDAWAEDGEIMAFSHKALPHYGVQFHPESLLTETGRQIMANFLKLAEEWRV